MSAPSKEQIAALRERLMESYLRQAWNSPSPDGVPLDSCVVEEAALTALLDEYDLRGKALEKIAGASDDNMVAAIAEDALRPRNAVEQAMRVTSEDRHGDTD